MSEFMKRFHFKFKIQTKLLFALLILSLTVLIISAYAVFNNLAVMGGLALKKQEQLRQYALTQSIATLERLSEKHLTSLANDQAKISNDFFMKVEANIEQLGWLASNFKRHPHPPCKEIPLYSTKEQPSDPTGAAVYSIYATLTEERLQEELAFLCNIVPTLLAIYQTSPDLVPYITTETGIMVSVPWDATELKHYDPTARPWYQYAIRAEKLSWTAPYRDKFTGELLMTCSIPFWNADGRIAGVVSIDVLLSVLIERAISTQIENVGYSFLIDPVGRLIASSGGLFKSKTLQKAEAIYDADDMRVTLLEIGSQDQRQVIHAMMRGQKGFRRIQTGMRTKNYQEYIAYAPVPATGWSLGIVRPAAAVLKPAYALEQEIIRNGKMTEQEVEDQRAKIRSVMIVLFTLALGMTLLTAFALAKKITRPIVMLHQGVNIVGQGNLNHQIEVDTGDELDDLAHAFNAMTNDLQRYIKNLEITTAAKKKIETELDIARGIQAGLLPQTLPQLPAWEIEAYFCPARQVAGDFYDMFPIEDGKKFFFVVADVCDKGVGPAMFAAIIRTLLRAFSDNYSTSAARESQNLPLCMTNDFTIANQTESNMFATAFAGVFDPETHSVSYVNCGHNPPYVIGADHKIRAALKPTGPILGVFPGAPYRVQNVTFAPGETLFVFTDGVTEAHDGQGTLLGDHRLRAILEQPSSSALETLQRVEQGIRAHIGSVDQFDDITMLLIQRKRV